MMRSINKMILCQNPKEHYLCLRSKIDHAIMDVMESGNYTSGEFVNNFEDAFATYIGTKYAIATSNGTDALALALKGYNIGCDDEVLVPAHTSLATIAAIQLIGATPHLIPVDNTNFTLNCKILYDAINPRTKAIIPVHLYGHPAHMNDINTIAKEHGLIVIEDCAHAHGAQYQTCRVGSIGNAGCFSFNPMKNLSTFGNAGMIVTNDGILHNRLIALRNYGLNSQQVSQEPGWNSKMDPISANILNVRLPFLDSDNARRIKIAAMYAQGLSQCPILTPSTDSQCYHVFNLYVITSSRRDELKQFLHENNIETKIHYSLPIHCHPGYQHSIPIFHDLSSMTKLSQEVLSLPMYPELSDNEIDQVINCIIKFYQT